MTREEVQKEIDEYVSLDWDEVAHLGLVHVEDVHGNFGISLRNDQKKQQLGVALCNAGPLCTCSAVWCSAWDSSRNHREDDGNRQGGARGRQADCQTTFGVLEKVAVCSRL